MQVLVGPLAKEVSVSKVEKKVADALAVRPRQVGEPFERDGETVAWARIEVRLTMAELQQLGMEYVQGRWRPAGR